jgi:hypothetical protein
LDHGVAELLHDRAGTRHCTHTRRGNSQHKDPELCSTLLHDCRLLIGRDYSKTTDDRRGLLPAGRHVHDLRM